MQINIHEAKTHLSRLINQALSGEDIVIAKSGTPLVRIVSVVQSNTQRVPGSAKGQFELTEAFFEPLPPEVLHDFES